MNSRHTLYTLLILTIFSSCKKENNAGQIGFKLQTANRTSQVSGRVASASIVWNSGSVFADKVEFEAEKEDEFEISYEGRVRRKIDLFASVPQQLTNISIPPGTYDEISIEIDFTNNTGDTAFVLRGTYNNNGINTPVLLIINEVVELEAEAEAVTIGNDSDFRAITTFDLSQLTTGISGNALNNATLTNGTLIISQNNNQAIYNIIRENLYDMDSVEFDD